MIKAVKMALYLCCMVLFMIVVLFIHDFALMTLLVVVSLFLMLLVLVVVEKLCITKLLRQLGYAEQRYRTLFSYIKKEYQYTTPSKFPSFDEISNKVMNRLTCMKIDQHDVDLKRFVIISNIIILNKKLKPLRCDEKSRSFMKEYPDITHLSKYIRGKVSLYD